MYKHDDEYQDLHHKVEQLLGQVETLSENQSSTNERYARLKQENEALQSKVHGLEDMLREIEINSETRQKEDEKRYREAMAKQARAQSSECEQHLNSIYLLQQELLQIKTDLLKSESNVQKLRSEKEDLAKELHSKSDELNALDSEIHQLRETVRRLKDEENIKSTLIDVLNEELNDSQKRVHNQSFHSIKRRDSSSSSYDDQEFDQLNSSGIGSSDPGTQVSNGVRLSPPNEENNRFNPRLVAELETNLVRVQEENRRLKELNEELQAQLLNTQLEEGRSLIQEGNKSYSLADEIGDIDVAQVVKALKEQQEDNARLRDYMDNILLKIVEHNPQLLDKTTRKKRPNEVQTDKNESGKSKDKC